MSAGRALAARLSLEGATFVPALQRYDLVDPPIQYCCSALVQSVQKVASAFAAMEKSDVVRRASRTRAASRYSPRQARGQEGASSAEIAEQDDGKCDHGSGDPDKQDVPDVMPGYALPFRDIGHDRWLLVRRCFEMVA